MRISIVIFGPVHIDPISFRLQFPILNKPCRFLLLAGQPRVNQGISVELSTAASLHALYSVAFLSRRCSRRKRDKGATRPECPAPSSRLGPYLLIDFCFIFFPFGHYDEPETIPYENLTMYPKDADVGPPSKWREELYNRLFSLILLLCSFSVVFHDSFTRGFGNSAVPVFTSCRFLCSR